VSRQATPNHTVGNEFVVRAPRPVLAVPISAPGPVPALPGPAPFDLSGIDSEQPPKASIWSQFLDALHRHSLVVFAVSFLLISAGGIEVGGSYWRAHELAVKIAAPVVIHTGSGLNLSLPIDQLNDKLQPVINQSATLMVGDKPITISPDQIKSWLHITQDNSRGQAYVHVTAASIAASITKLAEAQTRPALNQVTAVHDGITSVIAVGRNGIRLTNPADLQEQSAQAAKTLLSGGGLHFSTQTQPLPFQSVTPAAFSKLVEVNVVTKQMYLYDNGNLTRQYPISAGAVATPTPIGQFKTYQKLSVQDMKGFNANGTKYFQPHVRWINYFLPGGYAIHGNYWRPASWFGVRNSSHGCVSLPDSQAQWVYNWMPVGTTVITHT
jgi:lipoprotein-anchoring transpeptidase ErfK/SrfK